MHLQSNLLLTLNICDRFAKNISLTFNAAKSMSIATDKMFDILLNTKLFFGLGERMYLLGTTICCGKQFRTDLGDNGHKFYVSLNNILQFCMQMSEECVLHVTDDHCLLERTDGRGCYLVSK